VSVAVKAQCLEVWEPRWTHKGRHTIGVDGKMERTWMPGAAEQLN
jgi:hypothetical protein